MCSCVTVLSEGKVKAARKDYACDSSTYLRDVLRDMELTFSEKRQVVKARQNKWMIKKGEPYYKQNNVGDGHLYSFRCIPSIHSICMKYDLYSDDC